MSTDPPRFADAHDAIAHAVNDSASSSFSSSSEPSSRFQSLQVLGPPLVERAACVARIKGALQLLSPDAFLTDDAALLINDLLTHFVDDATSNAVDVAKLRTSTFEAGNLGSAPLLQPSSSAVPPPVLMASDLMPYISEVWPSLVAIANDSTLHAAPSTAGATAAAASSSGSLSAASSASSGAPQTSKSSGEKS